MNEQRNSGKSISSYAM